MKQYIFFSLFFYENVTMKDELLDIHEEFMCISPAESGGETGNKPSECSQMVWLQVGQMEGGLSLREMGLAMH